MKPIELAYIRNPKHTTRMIGDFIVRCVRQAGAKGCIVGLSGGVDSTTAAALAVRAFRKTKLLVRGCLLPSGVNRADERSAALDVATRLDISCIELPIAGIVASFEPVTYAAFHGENAVFHTGNLTSRIRANVLSTEAATRNLLVLGTGNRDEDFGLGYYTLFGDGAVHLSPLGSLSKRLVKELACYLGFEDIAARPPTAGLEPGQTDFGDLGYSYETAELVLEGWLQDFSTAELIGHPQVRASFAKDRAAGSKFKTVAAAVRDIAKRHVRAQAKAQILHPPVADVCLEYAIPRGWPC